MLSQLQDPSKSAIWVERSQKVVEYCNLDAYMNLIVAFPVYSTVVRIVEMVSFPYQNVICNLHIFVWIINTYIYSISKTL